MRALVRASGSFAFPVVLLVALALLALPPTPAGTQSDSEDPQQSTAESREEEKRQAKEARIEEYLRKKEERIARREAQRRQREEQKAREEQERQAAQAEAPPAPAPAPPPRAAKPRKEKRGKKAAARTALPRDLARTHDVLWQGPLGQDPTVQGYLSLIETGQATPQQIAAFANFLGQAGMTRAGIAYYDLALDMNDEDPLLWLNVGTLHRQVGELSPAASAYSRSLALDPNNAYAHYNLGAVLDSMGKYEEAVEEYRLALTLDPSLGDPAVNPQAANNDRLLAVKLMLYKQQIGSLGLPLVDVPGGELDAGSAGEESEEEP